MNRKRTLDLQKKGIWLLISRFPTSCQAKILFLILLADMGNVFRVLFGSKP